MARVVLVDSGPLVAVLSARDKHHQWARSHFEALHQPLLTCEAVLSEAFFLLRKAPGAPDRLAQLLERGVVLVDFGLPDHLSRALDLMRAYGNVPMSLADACLVRMSELAANPLVLTTDADFRIYRRNGRQMIPCMLP